MKKIIIFIIVILALTFDTYAEPKLNLSVQNRTVSGAVYSADIYVNVNNTNSGWLSASSTIVLQYNTSSLDLIGFDGVAVQNLDSQLEAAGYTASQTEFGAGFIAVNLVTINPPVLKNGYFRLCTVRWNITNTAQMDNLMFNPPQTELYNGMLTQLNYGCNDLTCYSFTNPTPVLLQVNSPRMIFSLENRTISGSTLYADLKVSINSESSPWLVAASTIVIKYNSQALNLTGLDGVDIQNFDTQLSGAGYTATQTDFGTGFLALNLVTINPSVSKTDTFMLGTLRFNVIDNTKKDSLKFYSGTSEIYNGTLTQLDYGCNVPSCYQTEDPTPMDLSPAFSAPILTVPSNNATGVSIAPTLTWNSVATATSYRVQVSTSNMFTTLLTNEVVASTSKALSGLASATTYYWRVCAKLAGDSSSWSTVWNFRTIESSQTISLTSGWNMISANVSPSNPAMSSILSPLGASMQFAKNAYGNLYAPPFQASLSTWNILQAYQLRMNVSGTLQITGTTIVPENTPLTLNQLGWYWLPYYCTASMATPTALASISGKYLQIKSIQGQVYQPPFITTLSQLVPNAGYMIRMTATNGTLTYPANPVTKGASNDNVNILEPKVFVRSSTITGKTAVIAMELQNVSDGDEIGVFTRDGMLVGSSVWQEGNRGVVVWGDDEYTTEKDGATEGEELTVKIWSNSTKNIGQVNRIVLSDMAENSQSFTLTYETDAVHLLKAVAEVPEEAGISVSPQPASNEVFIDVPFLENMEHQNIDVKLYNQAGQLALGVESVTYDKVIKLNISNLSSGVYQLILNIDGRTFSEKVVVVK